MVGNEHCLSMGVAHAAFQTWCSLALHMALPLNPTLFAHLQLQTLLKGMESGAWELAGEWNARGAE